MFNIFQFRLGMNRNDFYCVKEGDTYRLRVIKTEKEGMIKFPYLRSDAYTDEYLRMHNKPLPDVNINRDDYIWSFGAEFAYNWLYYIESRLLIETIKWCLEKDIPFHYCIGDYNTLGMKFPERETTYIRAEIGKLRELYGEDNKKMKQIIDPSEIKHRHCK